MPRQKPMIAGNTPDSPPVSYLLREETNVVQLVARLPDGQQSVVATVDDDGVIALYKQVGPFATLFDVDANGVPLPDLVQ